MSTVLVTGSTGLVGSEAVRYFGARGLRVIGIDNDMRREFFGPSASTEWNRMRLQREVADYRHLALDIRDLPGLETVFREYGPEISLIIHAAAQPSHDWAASDPFTDFSVNATGTLNLLELTRRFAPEAVFIFTSTNKVYGDRPNHLPLVELETRWEIDPSHPYADGVDETMSIDQTLHSLFGASKSSADLLVQEYGRYFGMRTASFRGGCLTGPAHSGAELHGFLAYLMRCTVNGEPYTIYGYEGKQVRDNIHSHDLVSMFWHFYQEPRVGEVYNVGGGRHSNCSILEAIHLCEEISGRRLDWSYSDENRVGDHVWWITDVSKFRTHYRAWEYRYGLEEILRELHEGVVQRERSVERVS